MIKKNKAVHELLRSPTSRPEDLSEMLAAGTKEVHEKAENTQFVKDFLRGRIRKELFKASLRETLMEV